MGADETGNQLGEYLRARRALVTAEQAGVPGGPHRRVPGLRREEVAFLAGISVDYYLRLERGKDHNPSTQVLHSLARVLQLDDVETDYLLGLTDGERTVRPRSRVATVPARLRDLLASLEIPAFVESRSFDVLAANPLAMAFSPRLVPGQNRLRSLLLDPEEREFQEDWEGALRDFIASFRNSIGTIESDPRVVELVGELSLASARFRSLWARHDVRTVEGGVARVRHPTVGPLQLFRDKLAVGGVILVIYYPELGSESAERLQMLRTLSVTEEGAATDR